MTTPNPIALKLARNSARMAAVDDRFAEWAAGTGFGIRTGTVNTRRLQTYLEEENDALCAHLYGLDPDDLTVLYETFDHKRPQRYAGRLRRVTALHLRIGAYVAAGRELHDMVQPDPNPAPRCRLQGPLVSDPALTHGPPGRAGLCDRCRANYWTGPSLRANCRAIIDAWTEDEDPDMTQLGMFEEAPKPQSRPTMTDFEAWLSEPCDGLVGSPLWGVWQAAMELAASGLMDIPDIMGLPIRALDAGYAIPQMVEAYHLRPPELPRCPRCGAEDHSGSVWKHACSACGLRWRARAVLIAELDATGDKHHFIQDDGLSAGGIVR